jgi:hypothetical protein
MADGAFAPQASGQRLPEPAPSVIQQVPEFPQHTVTKVGTFTSLSDLINYIIKTNDEGNTYHRCAYPTCSDKGRFSSRRHAISHIRRVHLQEKPFMCSWYVDPSVNVTDLQSLQREDVCIRPGCEKARRYEEAGQNSRMQHLVSTFSPFCLGAASPCVSLIVLIVTSGTPAKTTETNTRNAAP